MKTMEQQQNHPDKNSNEQNNNGTIGQEVEEEKGDDPRSHSIPNPNGVAENEEDHHVRITADDEDPRDTVNDSSAG
ncbi:hypothetical protein [Hufsiella ginkgonis]|uniref:Uncharacterized protein n=1 Tax=Hufsiella ginkgonis TaxID=2695274 RepID=A0A7K1XUG7_9SPHI|nr:hypothetical protein [Hufsiella ginkgonis]MXV14624.1 hypothetical protein [Hufsiella ginkgonis]